MARFNCSFSDPSCSTSDGMAATEPCTRREFLWRNAMGVGGIALASMLQQELLLGAPPTKPQERKFKDVGRRTPDFPVRATAMISLFMHGGPSHIDLLDPKPELTKHSGEEYRGKVDYSFTNRASK